MDGHPSFLALVGPTASGKTSLSLEVGRILDGEVVSMDSRQIYRGMDVGTGKVTLAERALLPHHGLDLRDPSERYSAGDFARDSRGWIKDIRGRGRVPLLVGGTGFFLKALTHPMFAEPELDQTRLSALRGYLNELPPEDLQAFVTVLDPEREGMALTGGRQRLTRTIEMALLTGRPLSWWHVEGPTPEEALVGVVAVLDLPRDILYQRINRRVEGMVKGGLVDEVRRLLGAGFGPEDPGMTGAGYREAVAHLRGEMTLDEVTQEIQQSHRRYARRQITWFRHQLPSGVVRLDGTLPAEVLAEQVTALWRGAGKPRGGS
ncbi:tRNA (adenosine(37)-N6)-dimethylallyltransferase MiaA [Gemmatimonadota bacterium]